MSRLMVAILIWMGYPLVKLIIGCLCATACIPLSMPTPFYAIPIGHSMLFASSSLNDPIHPTAVGTWGQSTDLVVEDECLNLWARAAIDSDRAQLTCSSVQVTCLSGLMILKEYYPNASHQNVTSFISTKPWDQLPWNSELPHQPNARISVETTEG